jgi:hypothetical protein
MIAFAILTGIVQVLFLFLFITNRLCLLRYIRKTTGAITLDKRPQLVSNEINVITRHQPSYDNHLDSLHDLVFNSCVLILQFPLLDGELCLIRCLDDDEHYRLR